MGIGTILRFPVLNEVLTKHEIRVIDPHVLISCDSSWPDTADVLKPLATSKKSVRSTMKKISGLTRQDDHTGLSQKWFTKFPLTEQRSCRHRRKNFP